MASYGRASRALVMSGDLSTEGLGPLCWVLRNPDVADFGRHRSGWMWRGWVGSSAAGYGKGCESSTGGLGSLCCSLWRVDRVGLV